MKIIQGLLMQVWTHFFSGLSLSGECCRTVFFTARFPQPYWSVWLRRTESENNSRTLCLQLSMVPLLLQLALFITEGNYLLLTTQFQGSPILRIVRSHCWKRQSWSFLHWNQEILVSERNHHLHGYNSVLLKTSLQSIISVQNLHEVIKMKLLLIA